MSATLEPASANALLVNDGRGHFTDHGYAAGIALSQDGRAEAGMGLASGDVDRDGRLDLAVTNFSDEPTELYLGAEVGFDEVTYRFGLSAQSRRLLSWSVHLTDFDGDGWLELFTANGHVYPQADEANTGTSYGQADSLWRLGPGRYYYCARGENVGCRTQQKVVADAAGVVGRDFLQGGHLLREVNRLLELGRLLSESAHEVLGQNFRKAGDVEYVFLRVKRRKLAAGLGKGVNNL
jgi:hypothetical protein